MTPRGNDSRHFPHGGLTREIIGAFLDVHSELRPGLPEAVYHAALAIVLAERKLQARSEVKLDIHFHGQYIGSYRADMVVEGKVILELKAGTVRPVGAKAQLINYLRLSNLEVGLLLFFGPSAEFERVVASHPRNHLR